MTKVIILSLSLFSFECFAGVANYIHQYAKRYNVSPIIIEAVVFVESSFIVNKVGDDGKSFGLMMIQLPTARDLGFRGTKKQLMKPVYNIKYGVKYIVQCLAWSSGDICTALDMYNRGISNVQKYPYKGKWKTHRHVGKIIRYLKSEKKLICEVKNGRSNSGCLCR